MTKASSPRSKRRATPRITGSTESQCGSSTWSKTRCASPSRWCRASPVSRDGARRARRRRNAAHRPSRRSPASRKKLDSTSFQEKSHGRPTEQEVSVEARHAQGARPSRQAAHGGGADDRRDGPAPPHLAVGLPPPPERDPEQGLAT